MGASTGNEQKKKKLELERALFNRSTSGFMSYRLGQGLSRLLFSHGMVVLLCILLIAAICNNAVGINRSDNTGKGERDNDKIAPSNINEIKIYNLSFERENEQRVPKTQSGSKRKQIKRNECSVIDRSDNSRAR